MNRKLIILILAMIIAVHLIFVIPSAITKYYHGDEICFIECAHGVINQGMPIYNQSQINPNFACLWHPPLYIYLLSGFIYAFGDSSFSVRILSIIFNVLSIVLVYLIAIRLLIENKNGKKWALFASALYALNPLTIQSSIILDMEVFLSFLVLLFSYIYFNSNKIIYPTIVLFLIFWTKFPGPIILFSSFFIFFIFKRDLKKIYKTIKIFLISGLMFLVSFWVYNKIIGFDFLKPFKHSSILGYLIMILYNPLPAAMKSFWVLRNFGYFITPFFALLFIYATYRLWKDTYCSKEVKFLSILSVMAILFYIITGSISWNFPKYYILAIPYMSILAILFLSQIFESKFISRKIIITGVITALVIIAGFLIFMRDPIIPEVVGTTNSVSIISALSVFIPKFIFYIFFPLAVSGFLIYLLPKGKRIAIILIFLTLVMFFYINIIQLTANYSTNYIYGDPDKGIKETLAFLEQNNIPAESVAAHSHIGYYIGFAKFLDVAIVYNYPELFDKWVAKNKGIHYLIIFEKDIQRIGEENLKDFSIEKKAGDYYIFKRIGA